MEWKIPGKIKVYEALGAVADGRILIDGDSAKVFSSSRGKSYDVKYSSSENAMMSNDNGSYWVGYLGYPSVSFLMLKGVLKFNMELAETLKDIPWKDINADNKNDFSKTEEYVLDLVEKNYGRREELEKEADDIVEQIRVLGIKKLGKRTKPPVGY